MFLLCVAQLLAKEFTMMLGGWQGYFLKSGWLKDNFINIEGIIQEIIVCDYHIKTLLPIFCQFLGGGMIWIRILSLQVSPGPCLRGPSFSWWNYNETKESTDSTKVSVRLENDSTVQKNLLWRMTQALPQKDELNFYHLLRHNWFLVQISIIIKR